MAQQGVRPDSTIEEFAEAVQGKQQRSADQAARESEIKGLETQDQFYSTLFREIDQLEKTAPSGGLMMTLAPLLEANLKNILKNQNNEQRRLVFRLQPRWV